MGKRERVVEEIGKLTNIDSLSIFGDEIEICKIDGNRKLYWEINLKSPNFESDLKCLVSNLSLNQGYYKATHLLDKPIYKITPDPDPKFPELKSSF